MRKQRWKLHLTYETSLLCDLKVMLLPCTESVPAILMKSRLEGRVISTNSNLSLFVSEPGTLIPLGYLSHHLDNSAFLPPGPFLRCQTLSFLVLSDSSSPGIFLIFVHKSPSRPDSKSDVSFVS